jgi:hypothetical protein
MAGLIDNTTYTGKDTDGFFSVALLTGDTKSKVRLVPNVKSTVKLGSLDLGDILQPDGCSLEGVGSYTLDQKSLEVCNIAVKVPICVKDFEANYLSESLKPGSNVDENFPNGFVDYLFNLVAEKISEQTEGLFWQGDTAGSPADLCDGLVKKMLADATVIDQAATTLTSSNIIAEITKVYDKIPETISEGGKVVIFISRKAGKLYRQALVAANPALIAWNNGDFTLRYIDVELVVSAGMATNQMVAAEPMNLWYGTDLTNDEKEVEIVQDPLNKKQHFIITSFNWGVNYGVGKEIVLYS